MNSSEDLSVRRVGFDRRFAPPRPEGVTDSEPARLSDGPGMPEVCRSRSRSRSWSRSSEELEEEGLTLPVRARPWTGGV